MKVNVGLKLIISIIIFNVCIYYARTMSLVWGYRESDHHFDCALPYSLTACISAFHVVNPFVLTAACVSLYKIHNLINNSSI